MRILVTGSEGRLGGHVVAAFVAAGHDVVGFDLVAGDDVRDAAAVRAALSLGVDAVAHLAGIAGDAGVDPREVMATNVTGTWNVLQAACEHDVARFVFASSVNALGVFLGRRAPDYLPIDDDHPCYATSTYGVSKRLGEELCRLTTATTGLTTICLRFPWVVDPGDYTPATARRAEVGWWEYGAFVDPRDAASAVLRGVEAQVAGHHCLLVAAADAMAVTPPVEVADRLFPGVPWRSRAEFETAPWRPLLRTEPAWECLAWSPQHSWADHVERTAPTACGRARGVLGRTLRRVAAPIRGRRRGG